MNLIKTCELQRWYRNTASLDNIALKPELRIKQFGLKGIDFNSKNQYIVQPYKIITQI